MRLKIPQEINLPRQGRLDREDNIAGKGGGDELAGGGGGIGNSRAGGSTASLCEGKQKEPRFRGVRAVHGFHGHNLEAGSLSEVEDGGKEHQVTEKGLQHNFSS